MKFISSENMQLYLQKIKAYIDSKVGSSSGSSADPFRTFKGEGPLSLVNSDTEANTQNLMLNIGDSLSITDGVLDVASNKFASLSHKHAASAITSGVLDVARGGTGVSSKSAIASIVFDFTNWSSLTCKSNGTIGNDTFSIFKSNYITLTSITFKISKGMTYFRIAGTTNTAIQSGQLIPLFYLDLPSSRSSVGINRVKFGTGYSHGMINTTIGSGVILENTHSDWSWYARILVPAAISSGTAVEGFGVYASNSTL